MIPVVDLLRIFEYFRIFEFVFFFRERDRLFLILKALTFFLKLHIGSEFCDSEKISGINSDDKTAYRILL